MSHTSSMLLTDLGEYGLHALLEGLINTDEKRNIGDDCAVIPLAGDEVLLVNIDRLALNVEQYNWARLGVAQTLSDIICMGGRPEAFLVALTLPREFEVASFQSYIESLRNELASYGCTLIGGDTKEGQNFQIVGVGIGRGDAAKLVRRIGAEPGMLLGVTSTGARPWGLRWANAVIRELSLKVSPELVHLCRNEDEVIRLPMAESTAVINTGLIRAGLDLSDGIGGALRILSRASKVGINLSRAALRSLVDPRVQEASAAMGLPVECFSLSPGYNWENMYVFASEDAQLLQRTVADAGGRLTVIGEVDSSMKICIEGSEVSTRMLPADEKFARDYSWNNRFGIWRDNCIKIFAGKE